jgi:hypothetical protein
VYGRAQSGREHWHQAGWRTCIGYLIGHLHTLLEQAGIILKQALECFIPDPCLFTHDPLPQFHSMSYNLYIAVSGFLCPEMRCELEYH